MIAQTTLKSIAAFTRFLKPDLPLHPSEFPSDPVSLEQFLIKKSQQAKLSFSHYAIDAPEGEDNYYVCSEAKVKIKIHRSTHPNKGDHLSIQVNGKDWTNTSGFDSQRVIISCLYREDPGPTHSPQGLNLGHP